MTMRRPPAQGADGLGRAGLDGVGHGQQAGQLAVHGQVHDAGAFAAQALGIGTQGATATPSCSIRRCCPAPGAALHRRARRCRCPTRNRPAWPAPALLARGADDGIGQRMLAALVQAGRQAQHFVTV
jgi:hypothetical protein